MDGTHVTGIDPQVLRDHHVETGDLEQAIRIVEDEALAEQARLIRDHPMSKEKEHRLRRWMHRGR